MEVRKLLRQAADIVWHDRSFWLLGLLSASGELVGTICRLGLLFGLPIWMGSADWPAAVFDRFASSPAVWNETRNWLMIGLTAVTAVSLLLWIVSTIAEGGMIAAVTADSQGQQLMPRAALGQGYRHLARFVGVDTILYFPAFLILLLLMLTASAAMFGIVVAELSDRPFASLEGILTAAAACMTPMLLLLFPVSLMTQLFRRLAFRKVMLAHVGVRKSIGSAWQVIRGKPGSILIIGAVLWGTAYLVGSIFSLVELPLFGIIFLPLIGGQVRTTKFLNEAAHWLALIHAVVLLISVAFTALIHAYSSVVWTLVLLTEKPPERHV